MPEFRSKIRPKLKHELAGQRRNPARLPQINWQTALVYQNNKEVGQSDRYTAGVTLEIKA